MVVTRRKTRQNSNVFHMLTKNQIVQLREAFNLLDVDADSRLSVEDLAAFLSSIGSPFTEAEIGAMIEELEPNPNFMILLTCIGEKLAESDAEKSLCDWFRLFDDSGDGRVDLELLKYWMTERGEKLEERDFMYLVRGCVENSRVDYRKLASKIKHGEIVEEAAVEN